MPPSRIHGRYSIGRRPSGFASPTCKRCPSFSSPPHLTITAADLIKPGIYGASPSPRSVTFAPNITPVTYKESDDLTLDTIDEVSLPFDGQLFPPSEQPPNPASKRRAPPGKRRSLGYIPRPPNAFMLFRADFVRQKHVPGSIETNHGSLSKIIGNCWRALPLEEKRIWEIKAKQEKEAHSKRYPGYRFRPVHNKDKCKKKEKPAPTLEDERRCEEVAQLLLEGMKGDELAAAIRMLDEKNAAMPAPQPQHQHQHQPQPLYPPRRPSSVPLPDSRFHPIALPLVPFFVPGSRSASPVGNISRNARLIIGQRRPSSALPHFGRTSWGIDDIPMFPSATVTDFFAPSQSSLQRDESPLPEVDTSLFEDTFNFGFPAGSGDPVATVRIRSFYCTSVVFIHRFRLSTSFFRTFRRMLHLGLRPHTILYRWTTSRPKISWTAWLPPTWTSMFSRVVPDRGPTPPWSSPTRGLHLSTVDLRRTRSSVSLSSHHAPNTPLPALRLTCGTTISRPRAKRPKARRPPATSESSLSP